VTNQPHAPVLQGQSINASPDSGNAIAIIGMSCRFPGANSVDEFWRNLAGGVESIKRLTDEEILTSGVPSAYLSDPAYVKAAPVIDGPELFDASFFGFSPTEARLMDPQHRILLELAYEALENASCDPQRCPGRIGVFTGSALNTYFMNPAVNAGFTKEYIPTLIGNDKDFISTRISYKLNLKGPSINVQTACSTSLVAVHLACQSLLTGESDVALAGAISVKVPHKAGYFYDGGGVVSPDGHVRAFDAGANGTVFGSGGGVVVLKRLSDAIEDQDTILAVIRGSAVNNDGAEKAGYTAPSVNSQTDAAIEALANANIDAGDITSIEAHGSGTPVGDPIEVLALTKAFRTFTARKGFCAIGSVKTNVGHLDVAAGMAGIIKTVLALRNRKIPATLHYSRPNPEIDFSATPFYVNSSLRDWESTVPRRAGVMSTGMGGTNAFLVMEEHVTAGRAEMSDGPQLVILSARNQTSLDAATRRLGEHLHNRAENMDDVAHTLMVGRAEYDHRRFLVCRTREEAVDILGQEDSKRMFTAKVDAATKRPMIFLLPGIGDHYVGMAHGLYEHYEVFRTEVDRCARIVESHLGFDIRDILYPPGGQWKEAKPSAGIDLKMMLNKSTTAPVDPDTQRLNETIHAHPAQFTVEYALARLFNSFGVKPDAIVGHSMGEYLAACLAGVFSLEDALRLVATRAKLAQTLPRTAMLAVMLAEEKLLPFLNGNLSISLINGPQLCVVAGPAKDVAELSNALEREGIISRPVQNAHAFHSTMMNPIVDAFRDEVRRVELKPPTIPFISNATGDWITAEDATNSDYWASHMNRTARFSDALGAMRKIRDGVMLEIGPGKTLGVLTLQHPARRKTDNPVTLSSLRHHYENQNDIEFLLHCIGRLWLTGFAMRWDGVSGRKPGGRRIPLPTYSFEKELHWIEPVSAPMAEETSPISIRRTADMAGWFYVPSWKQMLSRPVGPRDMPDLARRKRVWLIFADSYDICLQLAETVRGAGCDVISVLPGEKFAVGETSVFTVNASVLDDYVSLVRLLQERNSLPDVIVHAWSLSHLPTGLRADGGERFEAAQRAGFYSVVLLARALGKQNVSGNIDIHILSNNIQDVLGTETLIPEKSTVLGPCLVIPQEHPNFRYKSIDLQLESSDDASKVDVDTLLGEFFMPETEPCVAYRENRRWVLRYEQVRPDDPDVREPVFRQGGVYLLTGGLGGIGYEFASFLAQSHAANLVLVNRTRLPDRSEWQQWVDGHDPDDAITGKIERIRALEEKGSTVMYIDADVADKPSMKAVIERVHRQFGALHGVIHAAGTVGEHGFGEIVETDEAIAQLHFRAKAYGLQVLDDVIRGKNLDFCLLMSSMAAILGGVGQTAYASANIFMDAFVRRRRQSDPAKWVSVNWDIWRIDTDVADLTRAGKSLAELGMDAREGVEAAQIALSFRSPAQVIVSTGDLNARVNQWVILESLHAKDQQRQAVGPRASYARRPAVKTEYVSGRDETERIVTEVWQDVLGIEKIGIHDNFSELGGHSLLAIKIVAGLRAAFQVSLPVRALFDTPTIAQLSQNLRDRIRAEVESLSSEEAQRLLAANGPDQPPATN
jgi:acyl transferase domain-containing protein